MQLEYKSPPCHTEAEIGMASAAMRCPDALSDIVEVTPDSDMLSHSGAREVYRAVLDMDRLGKARDLALVCQHLEHTGRLADAGGWAGVEKIFSAPLVPANGVHYAKIVREMWLLREMMYLGTDMANGAGNKAGVDAAEIRATFEQRLFALGESCVDGKPVTSQHVSHGVMDVVERYGRGERLGFQFGFKDIDGVFCGMAPKSVTVLAGRPGGGKSKLAGNIVVNLAQAGVRSIFYSLEMTNEEIGTRIACSLGNIDHSDLIHNKLTPSEQKRLVYACEEFGRLPIHWQDKPGMRPSELMGSLRRMKRKHDIQLAVVDHMLLMQPDGRGHKSRNDEVGEISRMLKLAAKEINIPILALCQMNRGVEGRSDDTPRLSDLRDSGNIEQDADNVIFLHRKAIKAGDPNPGTVDVHIAKQRNGPSGIMAKLLDRAACYRFENMPA